MLVLAVQHNDWVFVYIGKWSPQVSYICHHAVTKHFFLMLFSSTLTISEHSTFTTLSRRSLGRGVQL